MPADVLTTFNNPKSIMDYFSSQTVADLRRLNVHIPHHYTTMDEGYQQFVSEAIDRMDRLGLLVHKGHDISLNYHKLSPLFFEQLRKTAMIGNPKFLEEGFHANVQNFRNRPDFFVSIFQNTADDGVENLAVTYKGNRLDPMHDSLFYDMFIAKRSGFNHPINIFFAEEHLKTWLARRALTEAALLTPEQLTQGYFLLGNGLLDGKHMSSSGGNALYLPDLIQRFSSTATRVGLMLFGNPTKDMHVYTDTYSDIFKGAARMVRRYGDLVQNYRAAMNASETERGIIHDQVVAPMRGYLDKTIDQGALNRTVEVLTLLPKSVKNLPFGLRRTTELTLLIEIIDRVILGCSPFTPPSPDNNTLAQ